MTTIAWDGKTLAADRQVNCGGTAEGEVSKIVCRKKDGVLCGTSGSATLCYAFQKWFLAGSKGKPPTLKIDDKEATAFIIKAPGEVLFYDYTGVALIHVKHYTSGSGWELALGAMAAGATAMEAVAIAAQYDTKTGNNIDTLELLS